MDSIIRLIESAVQWLISVVAPLFEGSSMGYFVPLVLLGVATLFAILNRNRALLASYVLGWLIAMLLIGLYLQNRGDNLLMNLLGTTPRSNFTVPMILGFIGGFVVLFPFVRRRMSDAAPFLVAFVTTVAIVMMFLTYRAAASITAQTLPGMDDLVVYRRRYIGWMALAFGVGVLLNLLLSAANPPKPPPRQESV